MIIFNQEKIILEIAFAIIGAIACGGMIQASEALYYRKYKESFWCAIASIVFACLLWWGLSTFDMTVPLIIRK